MKLRLSSFLIQHVLKLALLFQLGWLTAVWRWGDIARPDKVLPLLIFSAVTAVFLLLLPATWFIKRPDWEMVLERREYWLLAGLATAVLLIGAYYASVQRVWPWDEENSFRAAQIVAEGGAVALLRGYSELPWLGAQHPPLMMLAYGYALRLFGAKLIVMRLVGVAMGTAVTIFTYLIGRDLYDRATGWAAALFLLSFPLILRQTAAAMTDIPVTFFFVLALWLTVRLLQRPSYRLAFLIAGVIGLGMLTKYTMAFIYPVFLAFFIALPEVRRQWRYLSMLALIPALFVLAWGGVAYAYGILAAQIETLTTYAALIMTNQLARQFALEAFTTRLPSALGPYNAPLIVLGIVVLAGCRQMADWLLLLWIGIVWLLLGLTLPDHRYFMLTFPAVAIVMGRGYGRLPTARALILSLLYGAGALYLFVDWLRVSRLFLP